MSEDQTGSDYSMMQRHRGEEPCDCYADAQTRRQRALDTFTMICQVAAAAFVAIFLLLAVAAVLVIQLL